MSEGWPNPPEDAENGGSTNAQPGTNLALLAAPSPPLVASPRMRLHKVSDIQREIRKLYVEVRNGKLASSEAGRLVWMLSTLANLIVDGDLETRLERLEKGRG